MEVDISDEQIRESVMGKRNHDWQYPEKLYGGKLSLSFRTISPSRTLGLSPTTEPSLETLTVVWENEGPYSYSKPSNICWLDATPNGTTVYTKDDISWSSVFFAPSGVTIGSSHKGEYSINYTDNFGKPPPVLSSRTVQGRHSHLFGEGLGNLSKLDLEGLVFREKDGSMSDESMARRAIQVLRNVMREHSLENFMSRREEFLDIVGGEVPVLPPDVVELGYLLLPVRVMNGCGGACPYCNFYDLKKARPWELGDIINEIDRLKSFMGFDYKIIKRFALTDGDALILPTDNLVQTLNYLNSTFEVGYEYSPENKGFVAAFANASTIAKMSVDDLVRLRRAGLGYLNMGMESGCQDLIRVFKPHLNLRDLEVAVLKLNEAGIEYSVNLMPELGGEQYLSENLEGTRHFFRTHPDFKGTAYLSELVSTPGYEAFMTRKGLLPVTRRTIPFGSEINIELDVTFETLAKPYLNFLHNAGIKASRYQNLGA